MELKSTPESNAPFTYWRRNKVMNDDDITIGSVTVPSTTVLFRTTRNGTIIFHQAFRRVATVTQPINNEKWTKSTLTLLKLFDVFHL